MVVLSICVMMLVTSGDLVRRCGHWCVGFGTRCGVPDWTGCLTGRIGCLIAVVLHG